MNFFTSAGFGGAAAVVAALIAYGGILYRARTDRKLAAEADSRQRWWEALMWLSDHAKDMPTGSRINALAGLARLATTEEQVILLKAIRATFQAAPQEERQK